MWRAPSAPASLALSLSSLLPARGRLWLGTILKTFVQRASSRRNAFDELGAVQVHYPVWSIESHYCRTDRWRSRAVDLVIVFGGGKAQKLGFIIG